MKIYSVEKKFYYPKNTYQRFAMQVHNLLVENFSKTFFVGGVVRNSILTLPISDIDLATSANPQQVIMLLQEHGYKIDKSSKQFGVVKVYCNKKIIEVTSFRNEQYYNSRFPNVTFTKSIKIDASRRDFTINSLYFSPKVNKIYDLHNGIPDIQNKILRTVGNPYQKFSEDPLRIVRACRFAWDYDFGFELNTIQALIQNLYLVKKVSLNRLQVEMNKSAKLNTKENLKKLFYNS